MNSFNSCFRCSQKTKLVKTEFSIYTKEKNIIINNYPLEVCITCGNIDIKEENVKKTIAFLNNQRSKNLYKKII